MSTIPSTTDAVFRIAAALERIANALEGRDGRKIPVETGTVVRVDGKSIAQAVVRYTLQQAARGPSSLVGGRVVAPKEKGGEQ